ncbi:MAG: lycopene cyclase domain-containing protein, partial [Nanoarchaeota archaeon]
SPVIIFLILFFTTRLNPIYLDIISMFFGALSTLYCRPDLKNKIWLGGFLFLIIYFISFLLTIFIYPNWVEATWNLKAISGMLILMIPLEELVFAFTFGMLWSSIYEHFNWYKLNKEVKNGKKYW